jgi:hypothetical protein
MSHIRGLIAIAAMALFFTGGRWAVAEEEKKHEEHGHKAAHGGCLNELEECENGHAEVKVDGNVLKLWFVGGGNDTKKSVRVPDKEITLTIKGEKGAADKQLVLKAKPIELAEEKIGDCSYFEGQADWLKDLKEFDAAGTVTFKGKQVKLKIDYPHGYDPDHDKDEHKQEKEKAK